MYRSKTVSIPRHACLIAAIGAAIALSAAAVDAQSQPPASQVKVPLVRQDFSDCANGNVPITPSPADSGEVWVARQSDGTTLVKVGLTASANTTYLFNLKCVHQIGVVQTNDEGVGEASFTFPSNSAGNVFAFDSYPQGAPAGNKFQSGQVKFQ
jgi:hypothetical protein